MGTEEDRGTVHSETEGEYAAAGHGPASAASRHGEGDGPKPRGMAADPAEESDKPDKPLRSGRRHRKTKEQRSFWKELPILIGIALILAVVIKTFAVQAFYIPSGSMENTLQIGDRILVNKIVYHTRDIHRGDIVVFKVPDSWDAEVTYSEPTNPIAKAWHAVGGFFGIAPSETDYIKRVIGLPGDHVQSSGNGAPVLVNGHALSEQSYLFPGNTPSEQAFDIWVPKGSLWVMGDHRAESGDSRVHLDAPGHGSIPENRVIGRAFVVVWPMHSWKVLSIPGTFDQPALASAVLPATPLAVGFAGATPAVLLVRRRRIRRRSER